VFASQQVSAQQLLWWDSFESYWEGQTNISFVGGGPGPYDRQQSCQKFDHPESTHPCYVCSEKTGKNSHVVSRQTAFNGLQALKCERNNGDWIPKTEDNCTARNELVTPELWGDGDDVWIGYALFLASKPEYGANGRWRNTTGANRTVLINQVTGGQPKFFFRLNWDVDGGNYYLNANGYQSAVPVPWDVWNTIVIRLLWKGSGGKIQVWQNGEKVIDADYNHPQGGYNKWKMGQYGNTPAVGYPQISFIDDLKIAVGTDLLDYVTPKQATMPPSAPTGLMAIGGTNQIILTWTAATGAASFRVKRSDSSEGAYSVIASEVTATTYTNSGLGAAQTWHYKVSAVNPGGESADAGPVSATTAAGTPPQPPSAPLSLTGAASGEMSVGLVWTHDNPAGVQFEIEKSSGGSFELVTTVSGTNHTVTGLIPGTLYTFRVRATNTEGASDYSPEATALTPLSYDTWAERNIANPEMRLPEQDANRNGLKNLMEYALDLRPGEAPPTVVQAVYAGEALRLRYTRNKAAIGVTYAVQVSSDLTVWSEEDVQTMVLSDDGMRELVEAMDVGAEPGARMRFMRLKVTRDQ